MRIIEKQYYDIVVASQYERNGIIGVLANPRIVKIDLLRHAFSPCGVAASSQNFFGVGGTSIIFKKIVKDLLN